jgi:hypothetical protein
VSSEEAFRAYLTETRQRGSGARSLASSRRARSRRFTGARRLLPTQSWTFRHIFGVLRDESGDIAP